MSFVDDPKDLLELLKELEVNSEAPENEIVTDAVIVFKTVSFDSDGDKHTGVYYRSTPNTDLVQMIGMLTWVNKGLLDCTNTWGDEDS